MHQRMSCCRCHSIAVARRGWVGRCVGGWLGRCVYVGGLVRSWLWVVDVFCSFLDPWCFRHSTPARCVVRTGYTSTAVRYCCTVVVHGGLVDRLVGVSMGWWVGGWLVTSIGMWLIAFVAVGGDPVVVSLIECFREGDPVLFLVLFIVRYCHTGPALA